MPQLQNSLRSITHEGLAGGCRFAAVSAKHAGAAFEGVCLNTPKNTLQMFCAFGREDASSRGLTAVFGIGQGGSPLRGNN